IYFDRAGQKRAVRLLGRLLTPGGTLFVGPSESPLLLDLGYASARIPLAFAFRRAAAVPKAFSDSPRSRQRLPEARANTRPAAGVSRPSHPRVKVTAPIHTSQIDPQELLEEAQRLADAGKVPEAMRICQRVLMDGPPSAQAFYLLGLLHDTSNDPLQ